MGDKDVCVNVKIKNSFPRSAPANVKARSFLLQELSSPYLSPSPLFRPMSVTDDAVPFASFLSLNLALSLSLSLSFSISSDSISLSLGSEDWCTGPVVGQSLYSVSVSWEPSRARDAAKFVALFKISAIQTTAYAKLFSQHENPAKRDAIQIKRNVSRVYKHAHDPANV